MVYDKRRKLTDKRKQQQKLQNDTEDANNPCTSHQPSDDHAEINDTPLSAPIYMRA